MEELYRYQIMISLLLGCIAIACLFLSCKPRSSRIDFAAARRQMVETQLKPRGISDERVLKVMGEVEREKFVLPAYQDLAYADSALPIDENQTISQPYIVALMTQSAKLEGKEKVLEIGTGSGYQAAILAKLAEEVYTIEILPKLGNKARQRLEELGYKNAHVRIGDGFFGWEEKAPFDAILITCAVPEVPQPLVDQLKEGGRVVAPVGEEFQTLKLSIKREGKLETEDLIPCVFVPMTGEGVKKQQKD